MVAVGEAPAETVTMLGETVQVPDVPTVPDGFEPLQVSVTGPVKPVVVDTVMTLVVPAVPAAEPETMLSAVGFAVSLNVGSTTLNLTVTLLLSVPLVPVTTTVSVPEAPAGAVIERVLVFVPFSRQRTAQSG